MDPTKKRRWLWQGLAAPPNRGLVRRASLSRLKPRDRLLLLGDETAYGLAVPLGQLARDSEVDFHAQYEARTTVFDWVQRPWIGLLLESYRPSFALVSLGFVDLERGAAASAAAAARIGQELDRQGLNYLWLAPPLLPVPDGGFRRGLRSLGVKTFPTEALALQRGPDGRHPSPIGYAGWAGAIWSWIG